MPALPGSASHASHLDAQLFLDIEHACTLCLRSSLLSGPFPAVTSGGAACHMPLRASVTTGHTQKWHSATVRPRQSSIAQLARAYDCMTPSDYHVK